MATKKKRFIKYKATSGKLQEQFGFKLLADGNIKNADRIYCIHCDKSFAYHESNARLLTTFKKNTPYNIQNFSLQSELTAAASSTSSNSQFGEGARPHLCMDEWNRPTPVRRRLSLTQAARGKPIPTGLALASGTKARSLEAFSQYSAFHL